MQLDHSSLLSQNEDLTRKLNFVSKKKDRMQNILEICDLNSYENEKWIRGLNKLISNYEKMLKFEKEDLTRLEKECK